MIRLVRVSGDSMVPTYRSGDLLLTRPVGRGVGVASRGDVVVVRRGTLRILKRVVGVPGDVVELEAGRLVVNGRSVDGRPRVRGALPVRWSVPAGNLFLAGDNAEGSDDSRVWGRPFVPAGSVEAVVSRRLVRPGGLRPRRRSAAAGRPA
ncbi:signal peptidase I [Actinotalea sp.]|uniref:signal peptidase I n=1 Tax=Actinotalea sp. TaxID=1872145 RepID=UPI00356A23A6